MKSEGNVGIADNDLIRDNSCYSNHQPINVMDNGNLLTNTDINKLECTPKMTGILKEFTELYTEKLQRIAETEGEEEMKRKVSVLECWVNDLGEQNSILVSTVEELEREASRRVSLLQEKLDQMALTTRESCLSLRDHQLQVSSMLDQKITAEEEVKSLREKVLMVQQTHSSLLQENSDLRQDFNTLLEVISRGRSTGRWYCDDVTFNSIKPDQIAGLEPSHGFRSSSPKSSEDSRKPCPSPLLADDESSVGILKTEVLNLKQFVTEKNLVISQRDQHIADLQCQLTELHHKLAAAHSQVDNTTSTLHSLMDRGRHDSFEISRRDDVIRQLLSPTRHSKEIEEEDSRPKLDVEHELSDNIDVMALRLADLEEECQELRHRNSSLEASHSRCDQLRDELTDSQNAAQEMKLRLRECTNQCQHLTKELQTKETLIESLKKELEKKVSSEERKLVNFQHHSEDMESKATQTEKMALDERQISRQKIDQAKFYKLENELSEKNIVIRELQNHLVVSREELRLKDETLYNVEQKLDASRRGYDEKEERMLYLTSQLTNLQLEVSRLHGNLQQIRMQLENKCELVMKLESENRSLTRHHNEKTSSFEVMRGQVTRLAAEGERKTKEIADQKITIGSLQEALVEAKSSCEKMKSQFDSQESRRCEHRSKSQAQRRLHKSRECSCRRARSAHSDGDAQVLELKLVIDELSSYLKEAGEVALGVQKESDLLAQHLRPDTATPHQEHQGREDTLGHIRNQSCFLVTKLKHIKEDLLKCKQFEERKRSRSFGPSRQMEAEGFSKAFMSHKESVRKVELDVLRSKMENLEHELEREKTDKEMLSNDANAVVSSVRQWLQFQKAANSHVEDKFQQQQREILLLSKENQLLSATLRNYQSLDAEPRPQSDASRRSSRKAHKDPMMK